MARDPQTTPPQELEALSKAQDIIASGAVSGSAECPRWERSDRWGATVKHGGAGKRRKRLPPEVATDSFLVVVMASNLIAMASNLVD